MPDYLSESSRWRTCPFQCDVAGRDWLHRSSSLRRQATARTPRRTGQGNCCWAMSLYIVDRPKPVICMTDGMRRNTVET